ncbi:MAG: RcnB family protein [Sphingomonadaceae bacterium]|nr:RcnB family protein [Sphingomonadaceae bacterium]
MRDWQRNRTYRDGNRNRSYRNDRRTDYSRDHRRWDRKWRKNNRYDWHRYRSRNRSTFRIGRYYSPYRSYSYRRIGIGFSLGSLFYSNRYWINDPWQYRLPQVYGPYRWVRYYDDVMLVNIYSGEVIDVIHDFFW